MTITRLNTETHNLKLLWSGTLANGQSATLAESTWSKYSIFAALTTSHAGFLIGVRRPDSSSDNLRMIGGHMTATPNMHISIANITLSGNTLKVSTCYNVAGATNYTAQSLTRLYGIV